MKRMSDVLPCLPIDGQFLEAIYEDGVTSREDDDAMAHAISHVDALADALGVLLNDACDNGMHNRRSVYIAAKALAAYRGDK